MSVFCATYTSIQYRLINTDFTNTNTAALFTEAALAADDDIRGHLAKRYDVSSSYFQTSTSAPPLLRKVGQDLTIGYIIEGLSRGSKEDQARSDRYLKRGFSLLEKIANFEMEIFDTAGSLIPGSTTNYAGVKENSSGYHNTFNEDAPTSWAIDQNKLDDIEDERDT
jgi:hypothetical protein